MPTGDFVNCSDGKPGILVGPWAKEKLHYIKRYCDIFNTGMKNQWGTRTYIDLFSGPGICVLPNNNEEIKGSPLLTFDSKTPFTHYYFNDLDLETIEILKTRAIINGSSTIEYINADCNSAVDELLPKLPSNSLDFCFIDPFNWEIRFDSIRKLTTDRRMDLAITFQVGMMKRALAITLPADLNAFFPDVKWYHDYQAAHEQELSRSRILLDNYENGLRELGYKAIKDYNLMANTKNVPLYHLIFASKNNRGADFWDKIAARSETGQMRMQGIG
jgi:three-Cys-motif partner protein